MANGRLALIPHVEQHHVVGATTTTTTTPTTTISTKGRIAVACLESGAELLRREVALARVADRD